MDFKQFTDKTLKDIEIKATEMFDKNFQNSGFFGKKWKQRKNNFDAGRGILIGRGSGRLRRGLKATTINGNKITWRFDVPYAKIHNEGGTIKTTQNVKPFTRTVKGKSQNVKGFGRKVNTTIPQRQFIGDSPQLKKEIEIIVSRNMKQFNSEIQKGIRK